MKADPDRKENVFDINDILVSIILLLFCIASVFDTLYTRDFSGPYIQLFRYTIYLVVLVCAVKLVLDFFVLGGKTYPLIVCMLLLHAYLCLSSWMFDLLSFRYIIVDNLAWILVLCVFYVYGYRQQFNDRMLQCTLVFGSLLFCVVIVPNMIYHASGQDTRGGAISSIYFLLSYYELMLVICSRKIQLLFTLITAAMILFSNKRTGLIVLVLGLGIYLYINALIEEQIQERFRKYLRILLLIIVGIVAGLVIIEVFNIGILDRMSNIGEDGGSGRDGIWEMVLDMYNASDRAHHIFGFGFHGVPELVHPDGRYIFAHNGFVEVLFDFGIVGIVIMVSGMVWFAVMTVRMILARSRFAGVMGFMFVHIIMFTLTSYLFEESRIIVPMCMATGISIGRYRREQEGYWNEDQKLKDLEDKKQEENSPWKAVLRNIMIR